MDCLTKELIDAVLLEEFKKQREGQYANLGLVALAAAQNLSKDYRKPLAVIEYYLTNYEFGVFKYANVTRRSVYPTRKKWIFQDGYIFDGLFHKSGRLWRLLSNQEEL